MNPPFSLSSLPQYVTLDFLKELRDAGFADVQWRESTPRHRTIVAVKAH